MFFSACGDRTKPGETEMEARRIGLPNPSGSGIETSDASATSLIKRGMVTVVETPRKLKGSEKDQKYIYRFHPFDNDRQSLRLTTAGNNQGKGFAEQNEIDLRPWANQMVEVQGSSFSRYWVYDAKINGIVVPDTIRGSTDSSGIKIISGPGAAQ